MLKITEKKIIYNLYDKSFNSGKILYFDIETTGLSSMNSMIYLIGAVTKDEHNITNNDIHIDADTDIDTDRDAYTANNTYTITQWFADDAREEENIIKAFLDYAFNFNTLVTFNGEIFDIPFINNRCQLMGIQNVLSQNDFISVDIYKLIKRYKSLLNLDNCKQKTIEEFMGIYRADKYNGGELINVYRDYLIKHNMNMYQDLMKHNYDDICGLVEITDIIIYSYIFKGDFAIETTTKMSDGILINCKLNQEVKTPIQINTNDFSFSIKNDIMKVILTMNSMELKYFYSNYKDYYYLPMEDTAIHKSVAEFVDKEHRIKAKKDNCYSKINGKFIKYPGKIINEEIHIYKDKLSSKDNYLLSDEFINSNDIFKIHIITEYFKTIK